MAAMIYKKPIVDSLRLVTGGQAFITASQLAHALGCTDSYLILDVAEELRKQMS